MTVSTQIPSAGSTLSSDPTMPQGLDGTTPSSDLLPVKPADSQPPAPVKLVTNSEQLNVICSRLSIRKLEPNYLNALRELGSSRIEAGVDEEDVGTLYVCRDASIASMAALTNAIEANQDQPVVLAKLIQQQAILLSAIHDNINLSHSMAKSRKNEKRAEEAPANRLAPFTKIVPPTTAVQINIGKQSNDSDSTKTTTHVINSD